MRLRRKAAALLASVVVAAGLIVFVGTPAQASVNGHSLVRNWQTGRCLDSNYQGWAYTLPCNFGSYQHWYVYQPSQPGIVKLVNSETGRCLAATAYGGTVKTEPCTDSKRQVWYRSGNSYRTEYHNWQFAGECLDSDYAGNVYTLACNGGQYQAWREGY